MSVVPPDFGNAHPSPHSLSVTGTTGGALPPRGSGTPSACAFQGLAPTVPSLAPARAYSFPSKPVGMYFIMFLFSVKGNLRFYSKRIWEGKYVGLCPCKGKILRQKDSTGSYSLIPTSHWPLEQSYQPRLSIYLQCLDILYQSASHGYQYRSDSLSDLL